MANNGRNLQLPGRTVVEEQRIDNDYAQQTHVAQQVPGAIKVVAFGGLTKLEHAAIEIAARNPELPVSTIVNVAESVLTECKRRITAGRQVQNGQAE